MVRQEQPLEKPWSPRRAEPLQVTSSNYAESDDDTQINPPALKVRPLDEEGHKTVRRLAAEEREHFGGSTLQTDLAIRLRVDRCCRESARKAPRILRL